MAPRTSITDPIRVDWLPALGGAGEPAGQHAGRPLAQRGNVGLTFAPGKHQRSLQGVHWERDLSADLDRLVTFERVQVVACLLEDHELLSLGIPGYVREVTARGLRLLRLPIRDATTPPAREPVSALLTHLDDAVARGERVAVHCAGGLGRAGTIAGCWLVRNGTRPDVALKILREVRGPGCPETQAQREYILGWPPRG